MIERCKYVDTDGKQCVRGDHHSVMTGALVGEHKFAGPETIPPLWWTAEETQAFVENLHILIAKGVVAVSPPTGTEWPDPAFQLGRLQTAAARYVKTVAALFKYREPVLGADEDWQHYQEALARLNELAPPECAP